MDDLGMPVHIVGHITVRDRLKWQTYKQLVPSTVMSWGGEVVLRGRVSESLDGFPPCTEIVLIRFPDIGSAKGWHASPEYKAIVPLRREAAEVTLAVLALTPR